MSLLVRKITRSKWPAEISEPINIDILRADAITSCLRTSSDTLSTWEVINADNINEAVLALASNFDKIETMTVIAIEKDKISEYGFSLVSSKGLTVVEDLKDSHIDVSNLTLKSIGTFASIVLETIKDEKVYRFSKRELIDIISKAVETDRLDVKLLKEKVREQLSA
ncbi:hypothetical protein M4S82_10495 [Planococcus sp. MERTA32b]|nr:hypothetical protein [Planococcus sp. MER TA 32b]